MLARILRSAAVLSPVLALALASPLAAQTSAASAAMKSLKPVAQSNRIASNANFSQRTTLAKQLPGWMPQATQVAKSFDLSQTMHLTVQLKRSDAAEAAVVQLIENQTNPSSSLYHQWVTPEELGALYGPTDADVAAITSWLTSQGLHVDSISGAKNLIEVSGQASSVANAFAVNFANYQIGDAERFSATANPSIPAALSGVVQSVRGLTEVHLGTHAHMKQIANPYAQSGSGIKPLTNLSDGSHTILPNDFAVIYDVNPVYTAGNTGATIGSVAQHIAVVGRSRVSSTDLTQWLSLSALSSTLAPVVYVAGTDPGTTNDGDQGEATLDVERTIGTAPGAITDLIVAKDTSTVDGVYAAAAYNVNTLKDKVMTLSFGLCESSAGSSDFNTYNTLFQTGAAGGISIFVSSGDSGADGCLSSGATGVAATITNANALCGPYSTCVGGTEFADFTSPSTYWSSTQTKASGYVSALSYIPEGAWNEPTTTTTSGATKYIVAATGGAPSSFATKPTWQTGTGVPADGKRDTPDVSFPAAVHDGYLACLAYSTGVSDCSYVTLFGGTSAAAPAMAAVTALVNTASGSAHGLMNSLFYSTATSTPAAFHDVTVASSAVSSCVVTSASMCNNSTPGPTGLTGGAAGYLVTAGYDLATGLGSIDVAKFIAAVSLTASTTTLTASVNPVNLGSATTLTATISPTAATGTVQFYSNGTAIGSAVTVSSGVATYSYTPAAAGTFPITAIYSGSGTYATSTSAAVSLVVTNGQFAVTAASTSLTAYVGVPVTDVISVKSTAPFASAVTLASNNAICSLSATSVTPISGGTATSTLTCTPTATGTASVTVTGTSGSITSSTTITLSVGAPFSLSANSASLSFTSGATTGNTSTITVTPVSGFTGVVNLTCSVSTGSAVYQPTCAMLPLTVTGGGTSVLTISSHVTVTQANSTTAKLSGLNWSLGALMLACLGMLPYSRRTKLRSLRVLPMLALLALGTAMVSGCGNGASIVTPKTTTTSSSAGSYVVTVTGTSGVSTASTTVAVTIAQ